MRVLLFHNPDAGDRELDEDDLTELLTDAGHDPHYVSLDDDDWTDALDKKGDLQVVAGGDGAVRKLLLGKFHAGDDRPFTILPVGTANNIARTLGLFGNAEDLAEAWEAAKAGSQPFDIGAVDAKEHTDHFVEAFGGGLFAELIGHGGDADDATLLGNALDRALLILRELLADADPQRWQLDLDGTDLDGAYVGVEILNTRFAGPNVALASEADPGDGQLDLVLVTPDDREGLLAYIEDRLALNEATLPPLTTHRGRVVRMSPPAGCRLHIDDQPWKPKGEADAPSIVVRVLSGALRVLVPASS